MRYAIISDIHSNIEALEAVLGYLSEEHIDKYVCPGDIVGYAANPKECIESIKLLNPIIVAGNHDWAASDKLSLDYFNDIAREALIWTSNNLSVYEKGYLSGLDLFYNDSKFSVVHSSLYRPEEFGYIFDSYTAYESISLQRTNACFIGHTHQPGIFYLEDGQIGYSDKLKLELDPHLKYIINVGSVGQPRDHDYRACFVIYDSEINTVEFKRVDYDAKKARDKIINAGLPLMLAERILVGR